MKFIFLSSIVDERLEKKLCKNDLLSKADSNFCIRLLKGFKDNNILPININYMPIGSIPGSNILFLPTQKSQSKELDGTTNVGFINIVGIKYISLTINTIRLLLKELKNSEEKICIITYDFYLPFLVATNFVHCIKKNQIISCLIAPYIPVKKEPVYKSLRERISGKLALTYLKEGQKYDSFAFLTEYMNKDFNIKRKPYVIVEGIAPEQYEGEQEFLIKKEHAFMIVYSGRLDKIYNIMNIIEAIIALNRDDVRLELCGRGDCVERIKRICKKYECIKYRGFLSLEQVANLQQKGDILINPRTADGEYTKYSFPSKTIEYLASGKPMIGFKLPGIPKEYDKYIHYIPENTVESICETINSTINKIHDYSAIRRAYEAQEFVCKNKSAKMQAKKIIKMLGYDLNGY